MPSKGTKQNLAGYKTWLPKLEQMSFAKQPPRIFRSFLVSGMLLCVGAWGLLWQCRAPSEKEATQELRPEIPSPMLLENGITKPSSAAGSKGEEPTEKNEALRSRLGRSVWERPDWKRNTSEPQAFGTRKRSPVLQTSTSRSNDRSSGSSNDSHQNQAGLAYQRRASGVPVICYHHNFPGKKTFGGFNVPPGRLQKQLAYLYKNGYHTISLHQLLLYLEGRRVSLPPKPVLLTFDDGLRSSYTEALPLLKRFGMQAVLFIYPGIIGKKTRYYLSWKELRALADSGHFEIASHTLNHPRLPEHSRTEIRRQLRTSKRILEKRLGLRIKAVAYPFGVYDRRVLEESKRAGYRLGFTIHPGSNLPGMNLWTLNRYMVEGAHSLSDFQAYLNMQSRPIAQVEPKDGSRIRFGETLRLKTTGFAVTQLRLGGKRLAMHQKGDYVFARLRRVPSSLGYLPLEIRAQSPDGKSIYRRLLYLDRNKIRGTRLDR